MTSLMTVCRKNLSLEAPSPKSSILDGSLVPSESTSHHWTIGNRIDLAPIFFPCQKKTPMAFRFVTCLIGVFYSEDLRRPFPCIGQGIFTPKSSITPVAAFLARLCTNELNRQCLPLRGGKNKNGCLYEKPEGEEGAFGL